MVAIQITILHLMEQTMETNKTQMSFCSATMPVTFARVEY